ncbi:MAG: hypothetical protein DHS20C06_04260 [Hyphobacterium sp.]|nr:MAG: hypothetical protein DHS20C06_04260 [Hyphobacterium sp.]
MIVYNIRVFISHSWKYSNHYDKLAEWIFEEPWNVGGAPLKFIDHSVPKANPIHTNGTEAELRTKIYQLIAASDVVVIPTGMYSSYSGWIAKEINGAKYYRRPILAVNPWSQERKSTVVGEAASLTVGWSKQSVINGIWGFRPR